ncbi:hydroxyisourate hydrolase [Paludibacterium yongneupense]|uniref:hydroxyisourate hydrolase n=1 Tax=Paludibacterium yongneupense TaxID=400061 RepID=UPI000408C650|nr:hydroxyisourate hydrolase [Paludibacterium yongneupense]
MSQLSIHVLDTANGVPAAGMAYCLLRAGEEWPVAQGVTTLDGRADAPLLAGDAFRAGVYELSFEVAAYFRARGVDLPEPPFLDRVTLRFGVADAGSRYHIPLLVSPWSYSTYRGS